MEKMEAAGCAKPIVGNEPFAVLLPDDLIWNRGDGALKQMADAAEATTVSPGGIPITPFKIDISQNAFPRMMAK